MAHAAARVNVLCVTGTFFLSSAIDVHGFVNFCRGLVRKSTVFRIAVVQSKVFLALNRQKDWTNAVTEQRVYYVPQR